MSGPSKKPTALRIIEGNRGKRAMNKQEPDPEYLEREQLAAPSNLDEAAAAVWNELAPEYQKARLIAKIDVRTFAMGCIAIADFYYATAKCSALKKELNALSDGADEKIQSLNGKIQFWSVQQSMAYKQASAFFDKFGGSPAARTRISLQPQMDLFGHGEGEKEKKYFAPH
jgi:phage terminase small subunit